MKNQKEVKDENLEKVTGGVEPVVEPVNEPGITPRSYFTITPRSNGTITFRSNPTIDLPQTDGTSTEALPNTGVTVKR